MSGEVRALPGLAASSSKNSPRLFIIILIFSILCFGIFGRDPWRGSDIYGTALIKNCLDALSGYSTSCITPNLYGSVILSEGPLFTWISSIIIHYCDFLLQYFFDLSLSLKFYDDVGRATQIFFVFSGLSILWTATKKLAKRRESKPNDPLGIGPTSEKFSSNIADCSVLLTISCLGLVTPWHEVGKTGLNLFLYSSLFYSLCIAPEQPKKAGSLFGLLSILILLSAGIGALIALIIANLIIFSKTYPWYLVRKTFHRNCFFFSTIPIFFILLLNYKIGIDDNLKVWIDGQISRSEFQPFFIIKTWLWTWWPLWPIVLAFAIQAFREKFLTLSHLQMPLVFLVSLILFPITGFFLTDGVKFIPIVPLAVLAAFGLLSLPRTVANLLDYFALAVFSLLGTIIWLYWIALHTGSPELIYQNVVKAAPGVKGQFSTSDIMLGIVATTFWLILIGWRIRVNEPFLWRPVVLSAGGVSLTWVLLSSLWTPALEVNRGFGGIVQQINQNVITNKRNQNSTCVGISKDDIKTRAILLANSDLRINNHHTKSPDECDFVLIREFKNKQVNSDFYFINDKWHLIWSGSRKADPKRKERFYLYSKN